ncbi:MAG: sugar phosphate nucleotidyltransferase [Bacteroidia bacterium]|nr:sugar phosphate nucleotidyltransferase [Bacteroidia bacterium]
MKHVWEFREGATLTEVAQALERGSGFLVVRDTAGYMLGIITDALLRRAVLNGHQHVRELLYTQPVCLRPGDAVATVRRKAVAARQRMIPVTDAHGRLLELMPLDTGDFPSYPNKVVIMAGGLGTRLGELTRKLPKPMLMLGHKPVLQVLIESFVGYGFREFYLCVNYKAEVIREFFGDGQGIGAQITYVEESRPLGTAGALSLIPDPGAAPMIVINGDLVTTLNYEHLLQYHREKEALATMCVHTYDLQVPYGVVHTRQSRVLSLEEKPHHTYFVNAGVYVLHPEVLRHIPYGEPCDMTTVFERLVQQELDVHAYIINEFWMDIGHVDQYEQTSRLFSRFQF